MNYYLLTNDSFWICLQNAGYRLSSSWLKEKKEKKKKSESSRNSSLPQEFPFFFYLIKSIFSYCGSIGDSIGEHIFGH